VANKKPKTQEQRRHYLFWVTYGVLILVAGVLGGAIGVLFGYAVDLPRVEELQQNQPNVVSYVYSRDGRVLDQFALEKRFLVSYEQVPDKVKMAILAAEDSNFFEHSGIDARSVARAALVNLRQRRVAEGGSTIRDVKQEIKK